MNVCSTREATSFSPGAASKDVEAAPMATQETGRPGARMGTGLACPGAAGVLSS